MQDTTNQQGPYKDDDSEDTSFETRCKYFGIFASVSICAMVLILLLCVLWLLLYAYAIPYFYTWTSVIAVICTFGMPCCAYVIGMLFLHCRMRHTYTISMAVQVTLICCFLIPGIVMLCYGFAGRRYFAGMTVAEDISVLQTGAYKAQGFDAYAWNDAQLYTKYYGYQVIPDFINDMNTFLVVALIAPEVIPSNWTVKPVIAVQSLFRVAWTIDEYDVESMFSSFHGYGDSSTVSRM